MCVHQDPTVYTSIDDAFATLMQYMSTTTRQCKVRSHGFCCGAENNKRHSRLTIFSAVINLTHSVSTVGTLFHLIESTEACDEW